MNTAPARPTGAPRAVLVSRITDVRTMPLADLTADDAHTVDAFAAKESGVKLQVAAFNSTI